MPNQHRALKTMNLEEEAANLPPGWGGSRIHLLKPNTNDIPEEEILDCFKPLTKTEKVHSDHPLLRKLRKGILKSKGADGSELVLYSHQVRAIQRIGLDQTEGYILNYCRGAGKTIIAAGIIASCYAVLKSVGKQHEMKILISSPLVVRGQTKEVLHDWLKLESHEVLEVQKTDDLTDSAIKCAKIIMVTRTLLGLQYLQAWHKGERGYERTEGTDVPLIFRTKFHRMIVDEVQNLKNGDIPWALAHAEVAKNSDKRVGLSGTLLQSGTADLAGESLALWLPEKFRIESNWGGDRSTVNFDLLAEFGRYKDEMSEELLGLPPRTMETRYFALKLSTENQARYNKVLKQAQKIRINVNEDHVEKKLFKISRAVHTLQQISVSPSLVDCKADDVHRDEALQEKIALQDGGALGAALQLLDEIREKEDGGRVIFTSFHVVHLKILEKYLKKKKPDETIYFFDAKTSNRRGMIKAFLNDDATRGVLLLSLAAGGTGIDIVVKPDNRRTVENFGCCNIIFFGARQFSSSMEEQAIGRIHRLNQRRSVTCYHLLLKGGVDEAIGRVQQEKKNLGDAVDGNFSAFSSAEGLHTWKREKGVLKSCWLLGEDGQPIEPSAGAKRSRIAMETVAVEQGKKPIGRVRSIDTEAPEHQLKF